MHRPPFFLFRNRQKAALTRRGFPDKKEEISKFH